MNEEKSIVKHFTTHLRSALAKAFQFANEFGHKEVTTEHILYGLAAEKGSLSSELLSKANFPLDLLKQNLIRKFYSAYIHDAQSTELTKECIDILTKAVRTAQLHEHTYIGTEHVLACLLNTKEKNLRDLFQLWQINVTELQRQILVVLKSTSKFPDLSQTLKYLQNVQDEPGEAPQEFPMLESVATEMTSAEYLNNCSPLIGREHELARAQQILGRRDKNNPLFVGAPGVGKTAIVEGLARALFSGQLGGTLSQKRIFSLELSSLVAGTMYRGEFEQRLRAIIEEVTGDNQIILFIDEIHTLVGAGSTGQPLDAANILKPALARGEIRCIGSTTWEEYQKHIAGDKALARRFQLITVKEPDKIETSAILKGVKTTYEDFHRIKISETALQTALDLSDKFLTHTAWPDKALDLIDEAASQLVLTSIPAPGEQKKKRLKNTINKLQKEKNSFLNQDDYKSAFSVHKKLTNLLSQLTKIIENQPKKNRLQAQHIREALTARTGIAAGRLVFKTKPIAGQLLTSLQTHIIGQDAALIKICQSLQRSYSHLKEQNKPLGSFLFLGPSGVGKTATAKALAQELFGDEKSLLRLDMSEFSEKHTLSRLLGAPAGYVGFQQSGQLTNALKQNPLQVILFDEVDKAHPDIFNILLQMLDEGCLTDASGESVDVNHALIVMTSNLGLEQLQHQLGFGSQTLAASQSKQELQSAAKKFFRLELLNRLDDLIYFEDLGIEHRQAIIEKKIEELNQRLGEQVNLTISPSALTHIAKNHYRQEQGVRSLQKALREQVEFPLSDSLFKLKKGSKISVDLNNDEIRIKQID